MSTCFSHNGIVLFHVIEFYRLTETEGKWLFASVAEVENSAKLRHASFILRDTDRIVNHLIERGVSKDCFTTCESLEILLYFHLLATAGKIERFVVFVLLFFHGATQSTFHSKVRENNEFFTLMLSGCALPRVSQTLPVSFQKAIKTDDV